MKSNKIPVMYNLFPRHFKKMNEWKSILPKIKSMNFNSVFVNPFHETGFSGSLYAVKDYFKLNPLYLDPGANGYDYAPLIDFVNTARNLDLEVVMDLVINHTAVDSPLTTEHPQWFKREHNGQLMHPFAIDPGNPSNVTVWGDLATVDNMDSPDRNNLWNFWDHLINFYQDKGILGFRCDAAYQVPAPLWKFLIEKAKYRYPESTFYAETLGCQLSQIEALANVGFDYLFNSVKWWAFDQSWAIDQHRSNQKIAPSLAFPESHDTERLASVHPGTEIVQKSKYAFASLFSQGVMMTMGYEYGATTRMDVVRGTPADVDKHKWDLTDWIGLMNILKTNIPVLAEEGGWNIMCDFHLPYIFLEKYSNKGNKNVYVCVNKNLTNETHVENWMIPDPIKRCRKLVQLINSPEREEPIPNAFMLDPADVLLFLP